MKLIFVLGVHRSGTSVLTKGVSVLGASLGSNLMPPAESNPKGFFEDLGFNELNIRIMSALGHDWDTLYDLSEEDIKFDRVDSSLRGAALEFLKKRFKDTNFVALKDPRVCFLIPFWENVAQELGVECQLLYSLRNPVSTIRSISKRDNFNEEKTTYIWIKHAIASLRALGKLGGYVVEYENLMNDPKNELMGIASYLGIDQSSIDKANLESYRNEFIEQSLQHQQFTDLSELKLEPQFVGEIYQVLCALSLKKLKTTSKKFKDKLARLNSEYDARREAIFECAKRDNLLFKNEVWRLRGLNNSLVSEVEDLKNINQKITISSAGLRDRLDHQSLEKESKINEIIFGQDKLKIDVENLIGTLTTERDELQQDLENRIGTLTTERDELQQDLENRIGTLTTERDELQQDLENRIGTLTTERDELQQDLENRIGTLTTERDELQQDLENRIGTLTTERDELQQDLENRIGTLTTERDELQQDLENRIGTLTTERDELQQDLENRIGTLTTERDELQQDLENRIGTLTTERDELQQDLKNRISAFTAERDSLKKELALHSEYLGSENQRLKNELDESRKELSLKMRDSENERHRLESDLSKSQEECSGLASAVNDLNVDLNDTKRELAQVFSEHSSLRVLLDDVSRQRSALDTQLATATRTYQEEGKAKSAILQNLSLEITEFRKSLEAEVSANESLRDSLRHVSSASAKRDSIISSLLSQNTELEEGISELQTLVEEKNRREQSLQHQVSESENLRQTLEIELGHVNNTLNSERLSSEALLVRLEDVEKELADVKGLHEAVQSSFSWRVTTPLRGFRKAFPKFSHYSLQSVRALVWLVTFRFLRQG